MIAEPMEVRLAHLVASQADGASVDPALIAALLADRIDGARALGQSVQVATGGTLGTEAEAASVHAVDRYAEALDELQWIRLLRAVEAHMPRREVAARLLSSAAAAHSEFWKWALREPLPTHLCRPCGWLLQEDEGAFVDPLDAFVGRDIEPGACPMCRSESPRTVRDARIVAVAADRTLDVLQGGLWVPEVASRTPLRVPHASPALRTFLLLAPDGRRGEALALVGRDEPTGGPSVRPRTPSKRSQ